MTLTRKHPHTPDGRYFAFKGKLWRLSNPSLDESTRERWVNDLMAARRAVRAAKTEAALAVARVQVDTAKRALGERGPVWWDDGAPDYNRHKAANTPYAEWYAQSQASP